MTWPLCRSQASKGRGGKIPHRRQIGLQPFANAGLGAAQDIALPFAALLFQMSIERGPVRKGRNRHHEVAPRVADQTLHGSFVVARAGSPVAVVDHVVRHQCAEPLCSLPGAIGQNPCNQTAVIVVEDRPGDRAEERKGMDVPIQPGLGGGRRIGPDKTGNPVRQVKGEEMRLLLHPADHDQRFAENRLCVSRRMAERHEHLLAGPLPSQHLSRNRSKIRFAVWRCLRGRTLSPTGHWSI